MKIDYTTWGSSKYPSIINLAKILDEIGDEKLVKRVNKIIDLFNRKCCKLISAGVYDIFYYDATRKYCEYEIFVQIPQYQVRSHLINFLRTKIKGYRNLFRLIEQVSKDKELCKVFQLSEEGFSRFVMEYNKI